MKLSLILAALLTLGSVAALAEEPQTPPPVQMTVSEMDQVVAGADRLRLHSQDQTQDRNPIRLQLKDGSCLNP